MDDSFVEATQALEFSDYGDETDDDQDSDKPVGYLNVPCQKGFAGKLFPIQQGENVIGRGENCSICIPLKGLSREHACIEVKGDAHFIYDKGSRNRTRRNKHFLAASVRYELKDKDTLTFGDVECQYQIGQQAETTADDTGSETGSESVFQTAAVDEELEETANITESTKSNLLGDLDDEGAESDASSDILQPTQPFANVSSTQSMLGRDRTQNGDTTAHITVSETPAPSKTKRFTDNLTLPESDEDTTDEEGAGGPPGGLSTMIVADSQEDPDTEKSVLIGAATQAYVCDSDVTTDDDIEASPKKRSMLMQPTQMYTESDVSTCSEESPQKSLLKQSMLTAATQAYVPDEGESPQKKAKVKKAVEPTLPYTLAAGIEPTQAYDMEEEEEEETVEKSAGLLTGPTQAYNMEGEEDEEEDNEDKEKENEKRGSTLLYQATQAYTGDMDKKEDEKEEEESDTSEEFVLEGDTENEDNDEEEADRIMAAPTLAVDDGEITDSEGQTVAVDDATQVFDDKDKDNQAETQVFAEDATQVIDESKGTAVKNAPSDQAETQACAEDATQVFEDHTSNIKQNPVTSTSDRTQIVSEDATQVFDETGKPEDQTQKVSEESTQVFENVSEKKQSTVVHDDATQVFNDPDNADIKGSNNEEATQVFDSEAKTEAAIHPGKGKTAEDGEATQAFSEEEADFDINATSTFAVEAETVEDEDTEGDVDDNERKPENEEATQVFDDTAGTVDVKEVKAKASSTKGKKETETEEATQVFEDQTAPIGGADETVAVQEDATLAIDETTSDTVKVTRGGKGKSSRKTTNKKQTQDVSEEATQVIADNTVKISEPDATVMVTEDATVAISESDTETKERSTRPARSGMSRKNKHATSKTVKAEDATIAVEDATVAISHIDDTNVDSHSGRGKRQYQRKGKGKKKEGDTAAATTAETVPVADTVAIEEEVVEETTRPKRGGRRGTSQKVATVSNPSNEKVEVVEDVADKERDTNKDGEPKQKRRGRASKAAEEIKAAEEDSRKSGILEEVVEETTKPKRGGRRGASQKVITVSNASNENVEIVEDVANKETDTNKDGVPKQRRRGRASKAADEVKAPEEDSRKSGSRSKRKNVTETSDSKSVPDETSEVPHNDMEPATRIDNEAKDKTTSEEATQRYGDDSDTEEKPGVQEEDTPIDEEDSTPDIAELGLVDDDEEESLVLPKPPLVPIPSRSPLKSALASPDRKKDKKDKSPSPRRVKFVSQSSDSSSDGTTRSKRGKKEPQVEESQIVSRSSRGRKRKIEAVETSDKTVEVEIGRQSRGRKSKKTTAVESLSEEIVKMDKAKPSSARNRNSEAKETAAVSAEKPEEETVEVEIGRQSRGRKNKKMTDVESLSEEIVKMDKAKPSSARNRNLAAKETAAVSAETPEEESTKASRGREKKKSEVIEKSNMLEEKEEVKSGRQSIGRKSNVIEGKEEAKSGRQSRGRKSNVIKGEEEAKSGRQSRGKNKAATVQNVDVSEHSDKVETARSSRGRTSKKQTDSLKETVEEKSLKETVEEKDSKNTADKINESKSQDAESADTKRSSRMTSRKKGAKGDEDTKEVTERESQESVSIKETESGRSAAEKIGGRKTTRSKLKNVKEKISVPNTDELKDKSMLKSEDVTVENKRSRGKTKNVDSDKQSVETTTEKIGTKAATPQSKSKREKQPVETPAKKLKTNAATPQSNSKRVPAVSTPKGPSDLDSSLVNSPTLRKSSSKPKVMFTGVVDEQGEKTVKDLGGELVSSVYDCTHLVTDQIRRTVKFLCCLSRGVPIVTPQWLVSSRGSGVFSDPSPFIVRDDAAEKKFKCILLSSLDKASEKQLLTGYKIHVTKSVKPDPAQMKDIIKCTGAQYLSTMPKTASERTVVISCPDDKATCDGAISAGIPVVSAEFILTGVLRQEVDINAHALFNSSNGNKRQAPGPATEAPASKKRKR